MRSILELFDIHSHRCMHTHTHMPMPTTSETSVRLFCEHRSFSRHVCVCIHVFPFVVQFIKSVCTQKRKRDKSTMCTYGRSARTECHAMCVWVRLCVSHSVSSLFVFLCVNVRFVRARIAAAIRLLFATFQCLQCMCAVLCCFFPSISIRTLAYHSSLQCAYAVKQLRMSAAWMLL